MNKNLEGSGHTLIQVCVVQLKKTTKNSLGTSWIKVKAGNATLPSLVCVTVCWAWLQFVNEQCKVDYGVSSRGVGEDSALPVYGVVSVGK